MLHCTVFLIKLHALLGTKLGEVSQLWIAKSKHASTIASKCTKEVDRLRCIL